MLGFSNGFSLQPENRTVAVIIKENKNCFIRGKVFIIVLARFCV
jgi:hypothetical protein